MNQPLPHTTHAAVAELKEGGVLRQETEVRKSEYLNNLIEQDHRRVKQRIYRVPGFQSFGNATVTISGIEPAQRIRKGQFDTSAAIEGEGASRRQMWEAVLAA